jgi:membrane protein required for colicin V production
MYFPERFLLLNSFWRLPPMDLASITLFDYILLAVLILFVIHGLWVGFLRQLPFVISLIGSYWAAGQYAGELMPHLVQITKNPKIIFGGGFLVLLIVSTLLLKLIGKLIGKIVPVKAAGWMNRVFLGAPLALAKVAILVVLVVMFWAATLPPTDHVFQNSLTAPYLEQGADIVRSFIGNAEIRKALKSHENPHNAPVQKKAVAKLNEQDEQLPPPPAAPAQPRQSDESQLNESLLNENDVSGGNPASSTEVLTR